MDFDEFKDWDYFYNDDDNQRPGNTPDGCITGVVVAILLILLFVFFG